MKARGMPEAGASRVSGGVRPPSPPRHDITAPEAPFHAPEYITLSSFYIVSFLTRTCLSGSSLISLSLLGFWVGSSLFRILLVKPFFFVNLILYEYMITYYFYINYMIFKVIKGVNYSNICMLSCLKHISIILY